MNRSSPAFVHSNSLSTADLPLNLLNSNTMERQQRRSLSRLASPTSSIIDSHLITLYAQLAALEGEEFKMDSSPLVSTREQSLFDAYHHSCLQLKARCKIEKERIDRRFDAETRSTRVQFTTRKSELKEVLLDRLRRKRKLVVDEMRSAIDIHSRTFDADPLLVTMQPPHPLQAKAYNFRQRPDMGQQTSSSSTTSMDDEYSALLSMTSTSTNGILSPIPQQQVARKRLVGAFSLFQLPRWTVKDEECEDDLRSITNNRK